MNKQQIRFCTGHDGIGLAYATSGHGPPIVKVANWLSHLEHDLTSPVWGHVIDSLSRSNTLIRYDERGCGLSDWEVADLSFEAWLRDLETIVEATGLKRFPLLGISQGASIAVAYAVRNPDRVSHLVLHGGYAQGRLIRADSPKLRDEAETMARLAELGWGQENPSFRQFFTSQFIPGGTREQHDWFNELERLSTSPENAGRFMREFNNINVVDLLPQVRCPALILHATHDARVPFSEGRLLASSIPQANFVPLDSPNHLVLASEKAWPLWETEVHEFLGDGARSDAPLTDPHIGQLTQRERELLELIAQGRDNAQIAATLDLSEKTVRNHITSIFAKLEVDNRARAIVKARSAGLGGT